MKISKFAAPKIAMALALALAVGKAIVGYMSGSLAVMSSAIDSLTDIFASGMNYFFLKKADVPPDHDHPFGHGKMEAYALFLQSVFLFLIGAALLIESVKRVKAPTAPEVDVATVAMMIISMLVSVFLSVMLRRVA
ncbi:MAG: cation diffusion facilitator family transporter, partial [Deferribacteraceae bacterium]|nr:cation diffusion facilitator family transporter [Deferribacteraceae bacterium]